MWTDPIVAEVRAAREAYAKKFGNNLDKIVNDLQQKAGRTAKQPRPTKSVKRKRRAA